MNGVEQEEMDPAAALRAVRQTRSAVAERARAPAWYYPVVGVIIGVQIAFVADPRPVVSMLGAIAAAIAVICYRRATGVWFNGLSTGSRRSRRFMAAGLITIFLAVPLAIWLKHMEMPEAVIGLGVAVGLFTIWFGNAWERLFRRDAGTAP